MSMEVIGLLGRSGTGKSHHALNLAREMKIEAIVDDGLLIAGNKILAGRSAKAENSRMAAVRRAIFQDEKQAEDVRDALEKMNPQRLLVLGTSEGMLEKIREALQLPPYSRIVRIEELASPEDLETARRLRDSEGTHVIPVDRSEVRRLIPVALVDALDSMFRSSRSEPAKTMEQRTQVKPYFSDAGSGMKVDVAMIRPLIEKAVEDCGPRIYRLDQASLQLRQGLVISLELASARQGFDLSRLSDLQRFVQERVQGATGRQVQQVELSISELIRS